MNSEPSYPRIVAYKVLIEADWEDGTTEKIDVSNVNMEDMVDVLEWLEDERAEDLGWQKEIEEGK